MHISLCPCHIVSWWMYPNKKWFCCKTLSSPFYLLTLRQKLGFLFILSEIESYNVKDAKQIISCGTSPSRCVYILCIKKKCVINYSPKMFYSLVTGRCDSNVKSVIPKHMLWMHFMSTYCDKSSLVWIMASCPQAKSHNLKNVNYFSIWYH